MPDYQRIGCKSDLGRASGALPIAAIEGVAFGGGFEIVLACDLVVASTTARFALPESRRGVVAASGVRMVVGGRI